MNPDRITLRRASKDDLGCFSQLFDRYPYKLTQQVMQSLDRTNLGQLYLNNLARTLDQNTNHWILQSGDQIISAAGLVPDEYHSSIYRISMARIQPWLNTIEPTFGERLVREIETTARDKGLNHLSVRMDGADYSNLQLFENHGWKIVDVSLKFTMPLPLETRRFPAHRQLRTLQLRQAEPTDLDWSRQLGSSTHQSNHFLNDPDLPREKTEELLSNWIERCFKGLAWRIYVLEDPDAGGVGFAIYLKNRSFAEATGRNPLILDFVLIDPVIRGGGIGPWFIEQTLDLESDSGLDYCELRPSLHNTAAVVCYERLGFHHCTSDFMMCKYLI